MDRRKATSTSAIAERRRSGTSTLGSQATLSTHMSLKMRSFGTSVRCAGQQLCQSRHSLWRRDASGRRLDDNCPGHMRMQRTKIFIGTRRRERKRVRAVGIEHLGAEVVGRHNRVRDVVLVSPGDGRSRFDPHFLRTKGEVSDLDCCRIRRPDWRRRQEEEGRDTRNYNVLYRFRFDHVGTQPCNDVSMMARRCSFCLKVTLAMPSMPRSLSSGTFMGPGDGAVPGAGCGNAVERAV